MYNLGAAPTLDDGGYLKKDFFVYQSGLPLDVAGADIPILAGASATNTFNTDGDSDFFWTKFTFFAVATGFTGLVLTRVVPGVDIIITDTTSGRDLMNSRVPLSAIAGTGELPFILPVERFIAAKSTIKIQFFNVSAIDVTRLRLSFVGIKAFKAG